MRRILTALVLIPTVIYVIFLGPPLLFQLVVAGFAFACFAEFASIAGAQRIPVPTYLAQVLGLVFLFAPVADWRLLIVMVMVLTVWAVRTPNLSDALPLAAVSILGILYIYGSWRCAATLRAASPWWLLFAVSLNWVGDSAAMYAGKAFGKHRLAPVVSPNKTWEGAVASALFTTAYGVILLPRVVEVPYLTAGLLALGACIAGQLGDLIESAMKRGAGVKDSGTMLPGHGGFLDRLDSTLFSMPVVALYLAPPF